jgi:hypothetical protein
MDPKPAILPSEEELRDLGFGAVDIGRIHAIERLNLSEESRS